MSAGQISPYLASVIGKCYFPSVLFSIGFDFNLEAYRNVTPSSSFVSIHSEFFFFFFLHSADIGAKEQLVFEADTFMKSFELPK